MISQKKYLEYKDKRVSGRYVNNTHIAPFLNDIRNAAIVLSVGESVEKRDIYSITLGRGNIKLLFWSQMHGNEATTTKALLDFIHFLNGGSELADTILSNCTLKMLPILNPDGAAAYTRVNANGVDLNRDAQELSQPESRVLRALYDSFQPDFCFNLHDQRTIYNVGHTNTPATLSFLAPAQDSERSISPSRKKSMQLIVAINKVLQQIIPRHIACYDDTFNANCVGDTFQMLQTPTLLFEAGHYPNDYEREQTRMHVFQALLAAAACLATNELELHSSEDYALIPENQKLFFDIIIKNANLLHKKYTKDLGILFVERLVNKNITFDIHIAKNGDVSNYFAHQTYNCHNIKDVDQLKRLGYWKTLSDN